MSLSVINEFYRNQTVFITGGTGFLGKILTEKLLRLDAISKLYILVRPKKGRSVEERYEDLFNFPCFDRLKNERPGFKSKVVFIHGDCEKPNLGLSKESKDLLTRDTSVVIYAAANVKFDQPLKTAAYINVRSIKDTMELAKKMPKLKAFVHVSTAYSNCPYLNIDETFYKPGMSSECLLSVVDSLDDKTLVKITSSLLGKWPNTYVFTKSIAEDLIRTEASNLPITIVRPAIVMTTAEEPMPGWIDNFYGITGMSVAIALGVVRSVYAKKDAPCHLVPLDYVGNFILAAAWNVAQEKTKEVVIYNYTGCNKNTVSWQKYTELIENVGWDFPTEKCLWYYSFKFTDNKLLHDFYTFTFHTLAFHLVDFVLMCVGKERVAVKNVKRLDYTLSLVTYFTINVFTFNHDNVDNLWKKMSDEDKNLFRFDMTHFDWSSYIKYFVMGSRVYLLKDPLETIPKGRKKVRNLRIAYYFSWAVLCYLLYAFLNLIFKFMY